MSWTAEDNNEFHLVVDGAAVATNGHPTPSLATSWQAVALEATVAGVQAGEIVGPVPALMARTDGVCLVYPGEIQSFAGEPESGKGWVNLAATAAELRARRNVLYLDFQDAAPSIVSRLLALETTAEEILGHFTYARPVDPFDAAQFYELIHARPYSLAILDGVSEAYALLGLDLNDNLDAARFLTTVARPIAELGAGLNLIDHVVKNKDGRGRYALGAQHKLAGIAAAYSMEVITPPSRQTAGLIKIRVEKDRHGHVRSHAQGGVIAFAHIVPSDDGGRVEVRLEPPETTAGEDGEFRPTHLMEQISKFVEGRPGATVRSIREGVQGRGAWKDVALRRLIVEGNVERRVNGRSQQHYVETVFREDDDTYVSRVPNVSDRVPDTVSTYVSRVPPLKGHGTGHIAPDTSNGSQRVPPAGGANQ